jgi:hypothetical protein
MPALWVLIWASAQSYQLHALARAYGIKYASENYGLLFTAQTIAGFAGALPHS